MPDRAYRLGDEVRGKAQSRRETPDRCGSFRRGRVVKIQIADGNAVDGLQKQNNYDEDNERARKRLNWGRRTIGQDLPKMVRSLCLRFRFLDDVVRRDG